MSPDDYIKYLKKVISIKMCFERSKVIANTVEIIQDKKNKELGCYSYRRQEIIYFFYPVI